MAMTRQDNLIASLGATHQFGQLAFGLGDGSAHVISSHSTYATRFQHRDRLECRQPVYPSNSVRT
jgi:hypothetical protein